MELAMESESDVDGGLLPLPRRRLTWRQVRYLAFAFVGLAALAVVAFPRSRQSKVLEQVLDSVVGLQGAAKGQDAYGALVNSGHGQSVVPAEVQIPIATPPPPPVDLLPWNEARRKAVSTVEKLHYKECLSLLAGDPRSNSPTPGFYTGVTPAISRLGIPSLKMQDASSGFRPSQHGERGTVTEFPALLALAASWDSLTVSEVATAVAREFRGKGANVLLGPGVNVNRVSKGGRNFEYISGDDPYLGAILASAYVKAVQKQNVMAVVKHFAFNEQETNRGWVSAEVSEETKWELYFQPFQAAISAGAGAVMCSYNRVSSTFACENEALLKGNLKDKMGFQGFVMSDWLATHSTLALERGLDMEMPSANWFAAKKISELDKNSSNTSKRSSSITGKVSKHIVAVRDAAVRILTSMYHLRLDAHPGCVPPCIGERLTNQRTEEHLNIARSAAASSIVMLKNEGLLPLSPNRISSIAILGLAADVNDTSNQGMWPWPGSAYAGGGSSHVQTKKGQVVTPLAAIVEQAHHHGIDVKAMTSSDIKKAKKAAQDVDAVIIVAKATSTEAKDREHLHLDDDADDLIWSISSFKPTVVLLELPGPILMPWRHRPSAILSMFMGGEQTGNAWADILFGQSPSGKLPVAIPASEADTIEPSFGSTVAYSEGLATSYRSRTFKFAWPFGHGLSYTHFVYHLPEVVEGESSLPFWARAKVKLSVVNHGAFSGREVVQAYVKFSKSAGMPPLVLRNFQKTSLLEPGEMQTVTFYFSNRDLSKYDGGNGWVIQDNVEVLIGASSEDIRHRVVLNKRTSDVDEVQELEHKIASDRAR